MLPSPQESPPAVVSARIGEASADPSVQPTTRMVWQPATVTPRTGVTPRLAGMRVLLLAGDDASAEGVERELTSHGACVRLCTPATAAPAAGDGAVDAIVDLTVGGAAHATTDLVEVWREPLLRTVAALREQYEDWAAETSARRLFYLAVTYLGGGMGHHPDDDLAQPLGGIWAGLAKTLHRELPNCNARVVDIALSAVAELPGIVASELGRPGEIEVGHRDGRRLTLSPVARPVGPPALRLGADDCVLISGGGRGIGWELARTLAQEHGMRILVTGREPFPSEGEPWWGAGEAQLKEYEKQLWSGSRQGRPLPEIRRDIARTRRLWELAGNITTARKRGLRIEYVQCDFTDREQVRALLKREGGALTGVVHNAGVDNAARLPKKTDDDVLRTVGTKIEGFLNLFGELGELGELVEHGELAGSRLKFLCNVGSLTGRLGGMVGQLEYAAANEGLARLGRWADRRAACPVMTLAWPTWDRIGLIANFSATRRYMAPLGVADGLAKWQDELLAGTAGEVTFVGPLGGAIDPGQATGYPVVPDLPGYAEVYPKIHHLGEVISYEPHARLVSRVHFDRATAPVLTDFLVDGAEAVPVSLLLENAVRGAEWVVPPDFPELSVDCVEDIVIPLDLLRLDGPTTFWERELRGVHDGRSWTVEVRFRRPGDGGQGPEAKARIVYTPGDTRSPAPPRSGVTRMTTWRSGLPVLRWRSSLVPRAQWTRAADGRWAGEVRPSASNDLWATPAVPRTILPVSALENVVRLCAQQGTGLSVSVDPLTVGRVTLHAEEDGNSVIEGDPLLGTWKVSSASSGARVMTLTGFEGPVASD
ncbi:KR domain-containing protein [Streptomyces sp. S.PB5]|uniref:KR domain-containing protein n=1 Tax=Streptomyces sp. S.PB5 TaxID=3020844 RepID=UPI0025AF5DFB|nr:KR domain-containing protein [Streptomyces sp. S.PB5]MDN3028372.1 KR domain-containing protein [Streptomyces sp. S.PB5]